MVLCHGQIVTGKDFRIDSLPLDRFVVDGRVTEGTLSVSGVGDIVPGTVRETVSVVIIPIRGVVGSTLD